MNKTKNKIKVEKSEDATDEELIQEFEEMTEEEKIQAAREARRRKLMFSGPRTSLEQAMRELKFVTSVNASRIYVEGTIYMDWLEQDPSEAEAYAVGDPMKARESLFDSWWRLSGDPRVWHTAKSMWERGDYDSVVPGFITVHGLPITCNHSLPQKNEEDPLSTHSHVGRQDVTIDSLMNLQWGVKIGDAIGVRGKINGMRLVRIQKHDKTYLSGAFEFEIPSDLPVNLCEYYGGVYYILHPYAMSSFSYGGRQFRAHPWVHPLDFVDDIMYDGVMVLTHKNELRVKKLPTTEVLRLGIPWEVGLIQSEGTVVELAFRPRPGKPTGQVEKVLNIANVTCLRATFPKLKDYEIKEIKVGKIEQSYQVRGGKMKEIILDSGTRIDSVGKYPKHFSDVKVQNLDWIEDAQWSVATSSIEIATSDNTFISPVPIAKQKVVRKSLIGSKIPCFVLVNRKLKLVMLRERGKKLDFGGGQLEVGETSVQAALRELKEEFKISLKADDLLYLGPSDVQTETEFVRAFVFLTMLKDVPASDEEHEIFLLDPTSDLSLHDPQPWVKRIWDFVQQEIGSLSFIELALTLYRKTQDGQCYREALPKPVERGSTLHRLCGLNQTLGRTKTRVQKPPQDKLWESKVWDFLDKPRTMLEIRYHASMSKEDPDKTQSYVRHEIGRGRLTTIQEGTRVMYQKKSK
jgi:8-oxo-dGTP pyrophosphatase MutT (NUDIX family)